MSVGLEVERARAAGLKRRLGPGKVRAGWARAAVGGRVAARICARSPPGRGR